MVVRIGRYFYISVIFAIANFICYFYGELSGLGSLNVGPRSANAAHSSQCDAKPSSRAHLGVNSMKSENAALSLGLESSTDFLISISDPLSSNSSPDPIRHLSETATEQRLRAQAAFEMAI